MAKCTSAEEVRGLDFEFLSVTTEKERDIHFDLQMSSSGVVNERASKCRSVQSVRQRAKGVHTGPSSPLGTCTKTRAIKEFTKSILDSATQPQAPFRG